MTPRYWPIHPQEHDPENVQDRGVIEGVGAGAYKRGLEPTAEPFRASFPYLPPGNSKS